MSTTRCTSDSKAAEATSVNQPSIVPMDHKVQTERPDDFDAPPPPVYGDNSDDELINDEILARLTSEAPHEPQFGGLPLPVVIPQTTKSASGVYYSPFVRAYARGLEAHGIQKAEFVTFIDGLNEAFIPQPVYEKAGVLGQLLSLLEEDDPQQWLATATSIVTGARTQAVCYGQTQAYMKTMNADLFHPAGLHASILSTSNMMKKVGYPEDKLQLPRLESFDDINYDTRTNPRTAANAVVEAALPQDDPRMRRIRALEGYVMPLDLDVPQSALPDDLMRRMSAGRVAGLAKTQERQLTKRRARGVKMYMRAERRQQRDDAKISRLTKRLTGSSLKSETASQEEKIANRKLPAYSPTNGNAANDQKVTADDFDDDDKTLVDGGLQSNSKEGGRMQRRIDRRIARSERKLDRSIEKAERAHARNEARENRIVDQIFWIVLAAWDDARAAPADDDNDLPKGYMPAGTV